MAAVEVTQRFGDRLALDRVSLDVAQGERVALIGPNGAGKTTLLTILAGIRRPTTGEVVCSTGSVGWVPQDRAVYARLSVRENLMFFSRINGTRDAESETSAMLDLVGLTSRSADPVCGLSGGNQQRLNVAVGLLGAPAAVLLDEPTAALDSRQRQRFWQLLKERSADGVAVVFSTHNVIEAELYAERLIVIDDGRIVFSGRPRELQEAMAVSERDDRRDVIPNLETAFARFLSNTSDGARGNQD